MSRYNLSTPKSKRDEMIKRIESRWTQLNDLILNIINDGIKYLFYVNSGGAVAVVAFIGTSQDIRSLEWPWWVLGLFFVGLVCVGFLNFARYYVVSSLQKNWQKDVSKFYDDQTDFHELQNNDDKRVEKTWWISVIAISSFVCFIAGGLVGFSNYKVFIKKEDKKMENISKVKIDSFEQKNHVPKQIPIPPSPKPSK